VRNDFILEPGLGHGQRAGSADRACCATDRRVSRGCRDRHRQRPPYLRRGRVAPGRHEARPPAEQAPRGAPSPKSRFVMLRSLAARDRRCILERTQMP